MRNSPKRTIDTKHISRNFTNNNLLTPIDENAKDGEDQNLENNRLLKDIDSSIKNLQMYASDGLLKATNSDFDKNGVIGR